MTALMSEAAVWFLRVFALVQNPRRVESIAIWQPRRMARSVAAHDYDIDDAMIGVDLNQLNDLRASVPLSARRQVAVHKADLGIGPVTNDSVARFRSVIAQTKGAT